MMKNAGRLIPALRASRSSTPSASSSTILVRPTLTKPQVRGHAISNYPTKRKIIEAPTHLLDVKTPHPGLQSFELHAHKAPLPEDSSAQITTLPNGVRVVSDNSRTSSCTVGVTINAGARLCTEDNKGIFHLLERMSFKSSHTMDVSDVVKHLEELGGMAIASCTRENILYYVDCLRDKAGFALELLADSVFKGKLDESEIEEQKRIGLIQYEEAPNDPNQLVLELLHSRAYGDAGLGRSIIMDPESASKLNKKTLQDVMAMYFTGPNMVVASVGLPHEELVEYAQRLFSHIPAQPPAHLRAKMSSQVASYEATAHKDPSAHAKWIGGMDLVEELPRTEALPPNHRPQTYIAIAFEGVSTHGDDIYVVSILSMLLGGGGSFTQGGPGKGIFSKLYREVVCRIEEVENLQSLVIMNNDSGIYGAIGSVKPTHVADYISGVLDALMNAPNRITEEELQRAKNQLKSSVLQNLENRGIKFEDMTRQILAYGHKRTTEEMLDKIYAITLDEVKRVAAQCVQSNPAIIVYGTKESISETPPLESIENYVANEQSKLRKKYLDPQQKVDKLKLKIVEKKEVEQKNEKATETKKEEPKKAKFLGGLFNKFGR